MRKKIKVLPGYISAIRLRSKKPVTPEEKVVVGVLTTPRKVAAYPLPAGRDARLKKEMTAAAREHGIFLFFFYPEGFDIETDTVTGHAFRMKEGGGGRWVRAVFQSPDVVYNRLSYRKDEARNMTRQLLAYLHRHPGIELFNPRFIQKWEVHTSLAGSDLTCDLIPETRLFTKKNLYLMLRSHPLIFIKPIDNSIGKGIIVVRKARGREGYEYKPATSDRRWVSCRLAGDLYAALKACMAPGRWYLVQRGLRLARINGRVFDLRAQVQKNGRGEWVLTGVGVRVAAPNKYVTHVPNGGSRADYDKVMGMVCGASKQRLKSIESQMIYIGKTVPLVLERSLGMNLGILSLDIGLEQDGRMQVIEANSKPSSFDEDHIRRRHLEYLNQYFLYLGRSS